MTNEAALKARIPQSVPQATIELALAGQGLNPSDDYNPAETGNQRGLDLALADVILYVALLPETVRELDYQLTQRDIDGLLRLRSGLMAKWDEPDTFGTAAQITDISDLH